MSQDSGNFRLSEWKKWITLFHNRELRYFLSGDTCCSEPVAMVTMPGLKEIKDLSHPAYVSNRWGKTIKSKRCVLQPCHGDMTFTGAIASTITRSLFHACSWVLFEGNMKRHLTENHMSVCEILQDYKWWHHLWGNTQPGEVTGAWHRRSDTLLFSLY